MLAAEVRRRVEEAREKRSRRSVARSLGGNLWSLVPIGLVPPAGPTGN